MENSLTCERNLPLKTENRRLVVDQVEVIREGDQRRSDPYYRRKAGELQHRRLTFGETTVTKFRISTIA